jgi:hypothetical protein
MIKYKLICNDCEITFDSWFASSKEFEKLKRKKLLNCHNCNSLKIDKSLMAPTLMNKNKSQKNNSEFAKYQNIKKTIKDYQKFIKDNFKYVGENFAMRQDLFIMRKKRIPKVFMVAPQRKILLSLKKRELKHK